MTTEKIPSQDTPAQQEPPQYPPVPRPGPTAEGLPLPAKTPSVRPPKTTAEIIGRSVVDCFIVGMLYLASHDKSISGDAFLYAVYTLCGIRISDIVTTRKSTNGGNDPPIAGGLAGAVIGIGGSIADLFRPHG